jgi:predicted DCC family thiol-disulfide oxidoreductase YuxK
MIKKLFALLDRSHFPEIKSVEYEQKKLAVIRWITGLIVLYRFLQVLYTVQYVEEFQGAFLVGVVATACIFFFTIGFLGPLSTLAAVWALAKFDASFGCNTLGTNILSQFFIVLFLASHSRFYSVDTLLLNSKSAIGKAMSKLYSWVGVPTPESLRFYYFIGFFSYAIVSFCALSFHVLDENWVAGRTPFAFFPAAFLSKYYPLFREIVIHWPSLFMALSIFLTVGQSIFQFFMIPMAWTKWGMRFVIFWGFSFFVASLFFVNLSYLPHAEVLSWLAFFTRVGKNNPIVLLFDDRCNLCKKSVKLLKFFNFNGSVEFLGLSKADHLVIKHNLDRDEVRVWLYGIQENNIYKGYDLYIQIIKANPLLWVFAPLFFIGKVTGIGYRIYSWIANNRYKLFGTCELSYPIPPYVPPISTVKNSFIKGVLYIYMVVSVVFLIHEMPYLNVEVPKRLVSAGLGSINIGMDRTLYLFGLKTPMVFNEDDLKMNQKYFVLYRKTAQGEELIPFIDENGGRLPYFGSDWLHLTNHGSDLLYFSTTMKHQRSLIWYEPDDFYKPGNYGDRFMRRLIMVDIKHRQLKGNQTYKVYIRENNCIYGTGPEKFDSPVIFSKEFEVNNGTFVN